MKAVESCGAVTTFYYKFSFLLMMNAYSHPFISLYRLFSPLLFFCIMDWSNGIFFTAFVLLAAAIDGTHGAAMVTGTVFCDQCKDGQVSLFDYPLYGTFL